MADEHPRPWKPKSACWERGGAASPPRAPLPCLKGLVLKCSQQGNNGNIVGIKGIMSEVDILGGS